MQTEQTVRGKLVFYTFAVVAIVVAFSAAVVVAEFVGVVVIVVASAVVVLELLPFVPYLLLLLPFCS